MPTGERIANRASSRTFLVHPKLVSHKWVAWKRYWSRPHACACRSYSISHVGQQIHWEAPFFIEKFKFCVREITTIVHITENAIHHRVIGVICLFIYFHFTQFKTIINKPIENNIEFGECVRIERKKKRERNESTHQRKNKNRNVVTTTFRVDFSPGLEMRVCCQFIMKQKKIEFSPHFGTIMVNYGTLMLSTQPNAQTHITHDR